MKSKKKLFKILNIENKNYVKQLFVATKIDPFIINGVRLAEAPREQLKAYQRRVWRKLKQIELPANVFSGASGKSYMDNARFHMDNERMFKVDISKFYPSISRDKVYKFFKEKMDMSSDVTRILTNFSTINLDLKNQNSTKMKNVNDFLKTKNINERNHLATGTPFGSLLSYLVNEDMYNELQYYADKNKMSVTFYVDDVAFSSNNKISGTIQKEIINIIKKHYYTSNLKKCKFYDKNKPKRITGGIITKDKKIDAQNKLIQKANNISKSIKENKEFSKEEIKNAYGVLAAIEMSDRKMPKLKLQLKKEWKKLKKSN